MWQEIASGNGLDILTAATHESSVAEGERAKLSVDLHNPIDPTTLDNLLRHYQSKEITDVAVSASGNTLDVTYRKGFAWLALIIAGLILLAIIVVSWRFYHEAASSPIGWITIAAVCAGAILLLMLLLRRDSG